MDEPNCSDCDDDNDGTPDVSDCARLDPLRWRNQAYRDLDNDGDGAGPLVTVACFGATPPAGFSLNNQDPCPMDRDRTRFTGAGDCGCGGPWPEPDLDGDQDADCIDNDIDGDGILNGPDCDDFNASIWQNQAYVDSDGDGDGSGPLVPTGVCFGAIPPAGFSLNDDDPCPDDPNRDAATGVGDCGCGGPWDLTADAEPNFDGDADADCIDDDIDGDGFANASDCEDFDPTAWRNLAYLDTDGDGVGTGDLVTAPCFGAVAPPGYSLVTGDLCPDDINKTEPGQCGCGVSEVDSDLDTVPDCIDLCPGEDDRPDADNDGTADCRDMCPNDPNKTEPGECGCGVAETDTDSDGVPDCNDGCPDDPNKTAPGVCGCGQPDADFNGDGVLDCDCNGNGSRDDLDILAGVSNDCDDNGIPDECEDVASAGARYLWSGGAVGSWEDFAAWCSALVSNNSSVPGPGDRATFAAVDTAVSTSANRAVSSLEVATGSVALDLNQNDFSVLNDTLSAIRIGTRPGSAALSIGGGQVEVGDFGFGGVYISERSDATASFALTGGDTSVITGAIEVGFSGDGEMVVDDGALVSALQFNLGTNGGTGLLRIGGTGAPAELSMLADSRVSKGVVDLRSSGTLRALFPRTLLIDAGGSFIGSGTLINVDVENVGDLSPGGVDPGQLTIAGGSFSQTTDQTGLRSGRLIIDLADDGAGGLAADSLFVDGPVSLGGSLLVQNPGDVPINAMATLTPIEATDPINGRFGVVFSPIVMLQTPSGLTQGALIPTQAEGPSTVSLVPITLDDLLFGASPFGTPGTPRDAVAGDITGPTGLPDGVDDLVIAIPQIDTVAPDGAVAVLTGGFTGQDGGFQFSTLLLYTGAGIANPVAVEIGDFVGDGTPEIAFANSAAGDNDVRFLRADPNANPPVFLSPLSAVAVPDGQTVSDLSVGNFVPAGIGPVDLAIAVPGVTPIIRVVALRNAIDWDTCDVPVEDIEDMDPIDLDGNGPGFQLGLAFSNPTANAVTIIANNGDIETAPQIDYPVDTPASEVRVADLDGDGFNDVVATTRGGPGFPAEVVLLLNNGNGTFDAPVGLPASSSGGTPPADPVSLAVADLDRDDDLDIVIVATNELGQRAVRQLRNTSLPGGSLSFAGADDLPSQPTDTPLIVRSGDFDNSGSPLGDDIVVLVTAAPGPGGLPPRGSGINEVLLSADASCPADLAPPFGVLDLSDVNAFVGGFIGQQPIADVNGDGLLDLSDVSLFVSSFVTNCGR